MLILEPLIFWPGVCNCLAFSLTLFAFILSLFVFSNFLSYLLNLLHSFGPGACFHFHLMSLLVSRGLQGCQCRRVHIIISLAERRRFLEKRDTHVHASGLDTYLLSFILPNFNYVKKTKQNWKDDTPKQCVFLGGGIWIACFPLYTFLFLSDMLQHINFTVIENLKKSHIRDVWFPMINLRVQLEVSWKLC